MLSDASFLTPVAQATEPRPDFKRALAGVGDKLRREAHDFFMDFTGTEAPDGRAYQAGDVVEYTTPDGVRRTGSLMHPHSDYEWMVQVDEGTQHIVPQVELSPSDKTPRHVRRVAARSALSKTSSWRDRRAPEKRPDGTTLFTLDVGMQKVSESEVLAYAAARGYEAVDMGQSGPMLRVIAQELPIDQPKDNTRGQSPGIETEEIQGTGVTASPGDCATTQSVAAALRDLDGPSEEVAAQLQAKWPDEDLRHFARLLGRSDLVGHLKAQPPPPGSLSIVEDYDDGQLSLTASSGPWLQLEEQGFMLGALDDTGKLQTRAYTVPHQYLTARGKVTATLSPDVVPLSGHFEYDVETDELRRYVYTASGVEGPYSSGLGPLPTREDFPSGDTDGDYVVKAESGCEPEVEVEAADKRTKNYYKDYYGPEYGDKATRDIPRRKPRKKAQMANAETIRQTLVSESVRRPEVAKAVAKAIAAELIQNPALLGQSTQAVLMSAINNPSNRHQRLLYRMMRQTNQRNLVVDQGSGLEPAEVPNTAPSPRTGPPPLVKATPELVDAYLVLLLQERGYDFEQLSDSDKDQFRQEVRGWPEFNTWAREQRQRTSQLHNKQKSLGHMQEPLIDQVSRQGTYLCMRLVWDPEETEGMSDNNVRHWVTSFVKGVATRKDEFPDFGTIGRPQFVDFDPEAGLARVMIRSSNGRNFPTETFDVEGRDNDYLNT